MTAYRATAERHMPRDETHAPRSRRDAVRILLVDDDEDSRVALRVLLESYGYAVYEAADGEAGVRAARVRCPDLILMDLMMPGIDGLEAVRRIRRFPELSRATIVCVSAMEGAREAAASAGFDDCVLKPLDLSRFRERVDGWLVPS